MLVFVRSHYKAKPSCFMVAKLTGVYTSCEVVQNISSISKGNLLCKWTKSYIGHGYPISSAYDVVLVAYTLGRRMAAKLRDQLGAINKDHEAMRRRMICLLIGMHTKPIEPLFIVLWSSS